MTEVEKYDDSEDFVKRSSKKEDMQDVFEFMCVILLYNLYIKLVVFLKIVF